MELVGRTVKNELLGHGVIKSFDSSSGLFEILYESGDSEEMNFGEVVAALDGGALSSEEIGDRSCGLWPAKRRRGEEIPGDSGESGGNLVNDWLSREDLEETQLRDFGIHGGLKEEALETPGEECGLGKNCFGNNGGGGLDLNVGICLDDSLDKTCFDEIRAGNGETLKRKHSFDVNVALDEETEDNQMNESGVEGDDKKDDSSETMKPSCVLERKDDSSGVNGECQVMGNGELSENDGCLGTYSEIKNVARDCGGDVSRFVGATLFKTSSSDVVFLENTGDRSSSDPPDKEVHGRRKRRRHSEILTSAPQTVLRRSSRRLSSANHVSSVANLDVNAVLPSPEMNAVLDKKSFGSCNKGSRESTHLLSKLELPASSKSLNADEISVLDLFSVYACLRSFSTILFLSPFDLETFVEALKDNAPNSLIDSIHLSLLQTLKLHLEFLYNEGSPYASTCLRSLNWGLLDLVTWPMYLVEYLFIRDSELKPGFKISDLKLFIHDYYNQPPSLKVEILRCVCDDVVEAETIRLELNRRTIASEPDIDGDRYANVDVTKKRRDHVDNGVGSVLTQEVVDDEANDWNSDECCLCKMDGILICCDGCPAAYHTRCVGITKELLPEGDWYCPECVINRYYIWMKSPKSLRGAELLGTDPHGRMYFSSCGYLLVLDSCDPDSSFHYYERDDLAAVIEVLKSSDILYGGIIRAISMNWNIPVDSNGLNGHLGCQIKNLSRNLDVNSNFSSSSLHTKHLEINEIKHVEKLTQLCKVSESATGYDLKSTTQLIETVAPFGKCEGHAEITPVEGSESYKITGAEGLIASDGTLKKTETLEETHANVGAWYLTHTDCDPKQKENLEADASGQTSAVIDPAMGTAAKIQNDPGCYINYYVYAQTAASVAQELTLKSSDSRKDDSNRLAEEIISAQMKAISKRSTKFCWPNLQSLHNDVQKENCGWCFSCRTPTDTDECLFKVIDKKPAAEGSKSGTVGPRSKANKRSHLYTLVCYILSVEERLSGLLSGPWQNPQYSKNWRKRILKATDVSTVKSMLLVLESNLRRIALSPEWLKQVDSVVTMGSASHVLASSDHVSSLKHVGGRKRARYSGAESTPASIATCKSGAMWWRGGRLSRQLFHWKVLPHSMAFKSGRQAGCRKILGISYAEGSEYATRSRYIAWRASVEMSTSVAQLACQVRELDSYIRWDDLENTQLFSHLSNESRKVMKLFKKVIIRRKCTEGTNVKYLLDFGKRKVIPDTVVRNGSMLEVSASERKKYWLDESLVPLHILRSYEDKKMSRIPTTADPGLHDDETYRGMKRSSRKRGLEHLLAKSEKSEYQQCGHCKKDVLIRDAVNCQSCEGYFHKRHVKKSEPTNRADSAKCAYTCRKCQDKICKKKPKRGRPKKGKVQKKKTQIPPVNERPKRLAARKVKYVALTTKKRGKAKKGKQAQHKKVQKPKKSKKKVQQPKKSRKEVCGYRRKRSQIYHTYWLNGVQLTRKPNDARVINFTERKLLLPSKQTSGSLVQPTCCLCSEVGYKDRLVYVNCEICQEWFHGDAFGITEENCCYILGFRCYKCIKRNPPPMCTYSQELAINEIQSHMEADGNYAKSLSVLDESPTKKSTEEIFFPGDGSLHLLSRNESVLNQQKIEAVKYTSTQLNMEENLDHADTKQNINSIVESTEQKACVNLEHNCENQAEKHMDLNHIKQSENDLPYSKNEENVSADDPDCNHTLMLEGHENRVDKRIESVGKEQNDCSILNQMLEQKAHSVRDSNHNPVLEEFETELVKE